MLIKTATKRRKSFFANPKYVLQAEQTLLRKTSFSFFPADCKRIMSSSFNLERLICLIDGANDYNFERICTYRGLSRLVMHPFMTTPLRSITFLISLVKQVRKNASHASLLIKNVTLSEDLSSARWQKNGGELS